MYYLLFEYDLQNLFTIYQILQYIQIVHCCIIDAVYLISVIATKCDNMLVGGLYNNFKNM